MVLNAGEINTHEALERHALGIKVLMTGHTYLTGSGADTGLIFGKEHHNLQRINTFTSIERFPLEEGGHLFGGIWTALSIPTVHTAAEQ